MSTAAADAIRDQFTSIAIDQIAPNPDNPRRIDDKHPSLDGLAESIRSTGLIQPITVRHSENDGAPFQILAGERRWRAARKAGQTEILCRVVDVTDEQAFHIITVENLQREDLHWLEEARGVEAMTKHGWDVATIAKHVGKSEQWVRMRAKLAAISPAWRKEVDDQESPVAGWPAAMLELVARFPIAVQDEMLDDWGIKHADTTAELQEIIDTKYLRKLEAAPWSLDDAKLVAKAGACGACPKRSSCQQQLFADAAGDRCMDGDCWDSKATAYLARAKADLKKLHPGLKTLSDDYNAKEKADFNSHDVKVCKEGAKGAMPILVTSGPSKGTLIYAQKLTGYDHSSNGGGRTVSKAKVAGQKSTVKERLAQLENRRGRLVCESFVKWFKGIRSAPATIDEGQLLILAAKVGTHSRISQYEAGDINDAIGAMQDRKNQGQGFVLLWTQVRQTLAESIEWATKQGAAPTAAVLALCLLDKDWAAKRNEWITAAETALPIPRALAADIAAGKPTKAAPAKPKPKAKTAAAKS